MRITIDLDSQSGQPSISTQPPGAASTLGAGFNGGAAAIGGSAGGSGVAIGASSKGQDGGAARGGASGSSTPLQARDAGAAPAQQKN